MTFGWVQVHQNCNWKFDVEIDGKIDREIYHIDDLRVLEQLSLIRDNICFYLSNFPWNLLGNILDWNTNMKSEKNRKRLLWFFQNKYSIEYLSSIFEHDTLIKISDLYDDYTVFFDDIPKLIDSHSAGAMIVDSWITFNEDWGFSIYRYSQWQIKKIDFTKKEYDTMLSHG